MKAFQDEGAKLLWWQGPPGKRRAASPTSRPRHPPAYQRGATGEHARGRRCATATTTLTLAPGRCGVLQAAGNQGGAAHRVDADQRTGRHPVLCTCTCSGGRVSALAHATALGAGQTTLGVLCEGWFINGTRSTYHALSSTVTPGGGGEFRPVGRRVFYC